MIALPKDIASPSLAAVIRRKGWASQPEVPLTGEIASEAEVCRHTAGTASMLATAGGEQENTQTVKPAARHIRDHDRATEWQRCTSRAAADSMAAYPNDAEAIEKELERELSTGPAFSRVRRRSYFGAPPKVNTDKNFVARLMFMARMIERKSWARKAKGKHGGTLGKTALRLLEIMLFVVNKRGGYLAPSYDTLAKLACMSRRAIVTAMGVLATMGFVTIHRRTKRVQTPFGPKFVQDCNAYEYHLPTKGLGAWARAIFAPPSECSKFPASKITHTKEKEVAGEKEKATEKWWLPEPWPTGDGGWR
jgi:hypothetical protein